MSTRQHKLPPAMGEPPFESLEDAHAMLVELNGRSAETPAEALAIARERATLTAWISVLRTSPRLREELLT